MSTLKRMDDNAANAANTEIFDTLFKAFNGAIKKSLVYSPSHPMSLEARTDLYALLHDYLKGREILKFGVTRDSIIVEGTEYGMAAGGFYLGLAAHLHDRQITSILINEIVRDEELDSFLDAMALDVNEVRRRGGIENILDEMRVQNIVAKRLEVEAIADELVEELDFGDSDDEILSAEEMFMLLREGELSANEIDKIILRAKQGPVNTAKLLVKLSDLAASADGDPSLEGRADYVAGAIEAIASVANGAGVEDKEEIFENITTGVTTLADDFKNPIVDLMQERFAALDFGPELLAALSQALNMAAEQTAGYQESGEPATVAPPGEDIRLSPEEVYFEFAHFYDDLPASVAASVEEEIAAIQMEDVEEQAIETLVEMLIETEDGPHLTKILDSLTEAVADLFREHRLELAAKSMKAMRLKGQQLMKTSPELVTLTRDALLKLADAANMDVIMTAAMKSQDPDEKKYGRAMMDMLGPGAIPGLLDMIAAETNTEERRKLYKIAAHVSNGTMEIFERRLTGDTRIVKAVIWVVCEFDEPRATDILKRALRHEDEGVRVETIRALASSRGVAGAPLITVSLDDESEHVREAAFLALGSLKATAAISKLTALASENDFRFRNLDNRLQAIQTLGAIGDAQALPVLEAIARKRAFRSKAKSLRETAQRAIAQLRPANTV